MALRKQAAERARKRNRIITIAASGVLAVLLAVGITLYVRSQPEAPPPAPVAAADPSLLVRNDSRMLSDVPQSKVTFVEFLDFECEACGAAYPAIEQLRQTYGDRVNFVVRYFPLPGHGNAMPAARAVEAAAQQGKFEQMYKKMFETQQQWGEQQTSQEELFRSYARELKLDMKRWEAAFTSPKTVERIQRDIKDGEALGVDSTPSFFVNGKRIQPTKDTDLSDAIEEALRTP